MVNQKPIMEQNPLLFLKSANYDEIVHFLVANSLRNVRLLAVRCLKSEAYLNKLLTNKGIKPATLFNEVRSKAPKPTHNSTRQALRLGKDKQLKAKRSGKHKLSVTIETNKEVTAKLRVNLCAHKSYILQMDKIGFDLFNHQHNLLTWCQFVDYINAPLSELTAYLKIKGIHLPNRLKDKNAKIGLLGDKPVYVGVLQVGERHLATFLQWHNCNSTTDLSKLLKCSVAKATNIIKMRQHDIHKAFNANRIARNYSPKINGNPFLNILEKGSLEDVASLITHKKLHVSALKVLACLCDVKQNKVREILSARGFELDEILAVSRKQRFQPDFTNEGNVLCYGSAEEVFALVEKLQCGTRSLLAKHCGMSTTRLNTVIEQRSEILSPLIKRMNILYPTNGDVRILSHGSFDEIGVLGIFPSKVT